MFNKMKQIKQLKEFESELKKEQITREKNGITVVVNLKMDIIDIKLSRELDIDTQEKKLKECLTDAMNAAKMEMAKRAQSMGGFGL